MNTNQEIARKNDMLRTTLSRHHGKVMLTRSVSESPYLLHILEAVRRFTDFSPDNDPYGEHDFGRIDVLGERYFWKIDYYDSGYKFFLEDGNRVLTVMQASEY